MSGFDNETVYATNWDFRGVQPVLPQVSLTGQLPIGTGASPAILVGRITCPDSSVLIGYSSPNITIQANGATIGQTITGDTGGALSPTLGNWNIISNVAANHSGATVKFSGSGSTLTLDTTDLSDNVYIGRTCGIAFVAASQCCGMGILALNSNTNGLFNNAYGAGALQNCNSNSNNAFGQASLQALTSGIQNCAFGHGALTLTQTSSSNTAVGYTALTNYANGTGLNTALGISALAGLLTGASNLAMGPSAAINYVGAESSNLIIYNAGTAAESNTIRIGTQGAGAGQQNRCFVAGIVGVTSSNEQIVTINSSTGQLGVKASSGTITWNVVTTNQTGAVNNGYIFVSAGGALTISLPTTSAVGDEFIVVLDGATSWQITQAASQQIRISSSTTTLGATGTLTSTAQGDSVTLVCRVANTLWVATSMIGNLTPA